MHTNAQTHTFNESTHNKKANKTDAAREEATVPNSVDRWICVCFCVLDSCKNLLFSNGDCIDVYRHRDMYMWKSVSLVVDYVLWILFTAANTTINCSNRIAKHFRNLFAQCTFRNGVLDGSYKQEKKNRKRENDKLGMSAVFVPFDRKRFKWLIHKAKCAMRHNLSSSCSNQLETRIFVHCTKVCEIWKPVFDVFNRFYLHSFALHFNFSVDWRYLTAFLHPPSLSAHKCYVENVR